MDIADSLVGEDFIGLLQHLVFGDDNSGAIDNAVIPAIALDQIVGRAGKYLGGMILLMGCAMISAEKDRSGFGIGLCRWEWAMGEDQHFRPGWYVAKAMATGIAAAV